MRKCIAAEDHQKIFFYSDIFIKCFMIIEMIMCDIAEQGTAKMQSCYPMLVNGMTAAFHKYMCATLHQPFVLIKHLSLSHQVLYVLQELQFHQSDFAQYLLIRIYIPIL